MNARKKASKSRPQFQKITEEMQQWAALLAAEVAQWPDVTLRPMFGMTAFYRKATMFGAVPATRSVGSPNAVIFKILEPRPEVKALIESDARVGTSIGVKQKWYSFELSSPMDLTDALKWFSEAYDPVPPLQRVRMNQKRKQSSRNKRR
jgi:hypothetical protein